MKKTRSNDLKYHVGVTTIGEKGQIVIPSDVRDALKLAKGERLVALTKGDHLVLVRPKDLELIAEQLSEGLIAMAGKRRMRSKHNN